MRTRRERMAEEVKNDEQQVEKPINKMTVAELREVLKKEAPDMTGLSGMKKDQLLEAVKEARGVKDEKAEEPVAEEPVAEEPVAEEPVAEEPAAEEPAAEEKAKKAKKPAKKAKKKVVFSGSKKEMTVKEMKQEIIRLRAEKETIRQEGDKKKIEIIRRRINRLKKMTRKAA
jgi:hypothetical protein